MRLRLRTRFATAILGLTALTISNGAVALYAARSLDAWATWAIGLSMVIAVVLCVIVVRWSVRRVFLPLEEMAATARRFSGDGAAPTDEVRAVAACLNRLMADVSHAQSTLDRSWNALLEAEKLASLGKLAAGMAHEIRNPLAAITMWLFVVRKAVGPDTELSRKFDIISEEMTRLENMVRSFLEFSRPPAPPPYAQRISLTIQRTLDLAQHQMHQKRLKAHFEEVPGLPPVVADPQQLEQVLLNLLNNAMEATPEGGEIRFRASLETDQDRGPMVVVRVQDNGPGIPPEAQSRIFEPFFTTKENGTGLGLYIASEMMTRLGGRLALECSTAGRTSFAVWTPTRGTEEHG